MMAAEQQFLPNVGPPVDPNTRFEVVAIEAFDGFYSGLTDADRRHCQFISVSVYS